MENSSVSTNHSIEVIIRDELKKEVDFFITINQADEKQLDLAQLFSRFLMYSALSSPEFLDTKQQLISVLKAFNA